MNKPPDRIPGNSLPVGKTYREYIEANGLYDVWRTHHGDKTHGTTFTPDSEPDKCKGSRIDVIAVTENAVNSILGIGVLNNYPDIRTDHRPVVADFSVDVFYGIPQKYNNPCDGDDAQIYPTRYKAPKRKQKMQRKDPLRKNEIKMSLIPTGCAGRDATTEDPYGKFSENVDKHTTTPLSLLSLHGPKSHQQRARDALEEITAPHIAAMAESFEECTTTPPHKRSAPLRDRNFYAERLVKKKLSKLLNTILYENISDYQHLAQFPSLQKLISDTDLKPSPHQTFDEWKRGVERARKRIRKHLSDAETSARLNSATNKKNMQKRNFLYPQSSTAPFSLRKVISDIRNNFSPQQTISTAEVENPQGHNPPKITSTRYLDIKNAALKQWENMGRSKRSEPDLSALNILLQLDLPKNFTLPTYADLMSTTKPDGSSRQIPPHIFETLMDPVTTEDFDRMSRKIKRNTAPGPTALSPNMLLEVSQHARERLREFISYCITTSSFPEELGVAFLRCIPKPGKPLTWENTRPIALCECLGKMISMILEHRLTEIELKMRHTPTPLFHKSQFAFLKGLGTSDPIQITNAILEHARRHQKPIHLANTDIEKAYDSVEFWAVQLHYERKGLPTAFCELMKKMDASQAQQIITVGGITRRYKLERGCRQGETLSCYRWNFFVDPLCEWLEQICEQTGYECNDPTINNVTFADDFTLFARSNAALRILLTVQNVFFNIYGVKISAAKSLYSHSEPHPPAVPYDPIYITNPFTNEACPINTLPPDKEFRVLGAYFTVSLNWKPQAQILQAWLDDTLARMSQMRAPLNMAVYVMNAAVIPHILYPLQVAHVSHARMSAWDEQIAVAVKKMSGVASSTTTAPLYLPVGHMGANLQKITTQQRGQLLFNTQLRFAENRQTMSSRLVFEQAKWYQEQRALPYFPLFFSAPPPRTANTYKNEIIQRVHTAMLEEGIIARCHDPSFYIHPQRQYDMPLVATMPHSTYNSIYKQLAKRKLLYVGDVLSESPGHVRDWASFRQKGDVHEPPEWYRLLLTHLTDSHLPAARNNRKLSDRISVMVSPFKSNDESRIPPQVPADDKIRSAQPYLFPPVNTTFDAGAIASTHPSTTLAPEVQQNTCQTIFLASDGAAKMVNFIPRAGTAVVDENLLQLRNHGRDATAPDWSIRLQIPDTYPHHIIRVYAAELWGLLAALCTAPHSPVVLYMDNQSIVEKFNRLRKYNPTRSMVKKPLHSLWRCVLTALNARSAPFSVEKTPSHSTYEQGGRTGNDAADRAAGEAMNPPTVDADPTALPPAPGAPHSPPDAPLGVYYGDLPMEFFEVSPGNGSSTDGGRVHALISDYIRDKQNASMFDLWRAYPSQGRITSDPLALGITESPAIKELPSTTPPSSSNSPPTLSPQSQN
jgi:hypothetical protein